MKDVIKPVFLKGEHIYLRPMEKEDLIYIKKWVNDPEIRGIIGEVNSMTSADGEEYFEKTHNDPSKEWFYSSSPGWRQSNRGMRFFEKVLSMAHNRCKSDNRGKRCLGKRIWKRNHFSFAELCIRIS